jgi:hypothetical protein
MKVSEVMELAGITKTGLALALIKDALTEVELVAKENVTQYTTDLTKDQTEYNLPSNLVEVTNVKIKDPVSGYWCPIPRVIIENYKEK